MYIKQVIVMRKDLKMRKGKMAAQAAHASMKVFFDRMERVEDSDIDSATGIAYKVTPTNEMIMWMEGAFTKVVVGCDSENEIYALQKLATELEIPNAVIVDNGLTEFHGEKTVTCIAIGPADAEKIDPLTGGFSLL